MRADRQTGRQKNKQVNTADEGKGYIVLLQMWKDARLSWDPAQFGDVDTVRLSPDRFWKPDIRLYTRSVYCSSHFRKHFELLSARRSL